MTLTWFHCFFYFNPRPPRGGRPLPSIGIVTLSAISIHALREEGDPLVPNFDVCTNRFQSTPSARRATHNIYSVRDNIAISIHALREEGDPVFANLGEQAVLFQSTPSARRATVASFCRCLLPVDFNPRPPRGGRPIAPYADENLTQNFNPRPPRGGRPANRKPSPTLKLFQSTPSARRATRAMRGLVTSPENFNPRPPRGGRLPCTMPCMT